MRPYYQDQLVRQLSGTLVEALKAQADVAIYAFSDQGQRVKQIEDIERLPFGASTMLDRSLDRAAKDGAEVVWMITDNIQDPPGSTEAGDTEQFYRKLRSEAIEKVTIFPLRQPPGRPGLVVYALLMKGGDTDLYEKGMAGFHSRAAGVLRTDALRMKPLDKDTVGISWVRANVNPRTSLITYDTGKPVKELIQIKFKSKFDHIEIANSSIEVAQGEASFSGDSLVYPQRRKIEITPRTVQRLGPGDETEQVYQVDVDLGELTLKRDLASLWKAAWVKSSEDATLQLGFVIRVPQNQFRLRQKFLQEFHAASIQDARSTGKVYAVDRLPSLMSEAVTEVQVTSPVVFRVRYPSWPTFLWLAVFAFGALACAAIFIAVKRAALLLPHGDWDVEATTQAGAALESAVSGSEVSIQGDVIGRIGRGVFVPATGARLVDPPSPELHVAEGVEAMIEVSRRLVRLKFKTKDSAATNRPAVAAPPRRR